MHFTGTKSFIRPRLFFLLRYNNVKLAWYDLLHSLKSSLLNAQYKYKLAPLSTTKETHQPLFRAVMVKKLRNQNIFYIEDLT